MSKVETRCTQRKEKQSMKKVVMVDTGYKNYDTEQSILDGVGGCFIEAPCQGDPDRILAATHDAHAILLRESPLPAAVIDQLEHCQIIVRYGAGVDNIDLEAAAKRGIFVANVPDYGYEEVSDQALALLMAVTRRTVTRDSDVRNGHWNIARTEPMHRLAGKTLGIVGYGGIAKTFHRKTMGLNFSRVLVFDKYLIKEQEGIKQVELETLFRESDVISLHLPLTDETYHLVNRDLLGLMKKDAIIINTARGGLIDERALAESLGNNLIFGAGIDVFEAEPISSDHPLIGQKNAVLSDHTGWYSEESINDLQRKAAEEVARVLKGKKPRNWVNSFS